jgi:predicted DNA-binding protein
MSPAKGRPPSKNPKNVDTRIRLSEDEARMLDFCKEKTGMTKADVIRRGIKKIYDEIILGKFKQ